ncbi:hypothetical protein [Brumimicrobium mesophilum]|uniref:hypothetical protein n=1 Tax=Brumimicrobium mesophilum TaxID=392717 RepID=UPI000D14401B|nr:hypothetical protein [Brumimicrobium mesophilum]
MLKKLFTFLAVVLISLSAISQTVISSEKTVKNKPSKRSLLHFHNDLSIFSKRSLVANPGATGYMLQVFKGKKKEIKRFNASTKFNGDFSNVTDYIFREESFLTINESKIENVITFHLQEFDYNFKKIGEPIKLVEIENETNKPFAAGNYNTIGIFQGKTYAKKSIQFQYNKESNRYVLIVEVDISNRMGYLEIFVFDSDFSLITSHNIKAENEKDNITVSEITTLPHGEILAIVKNINGSQINEFYLLHLFDDGNYQVNDLRPNESTLIDTQFSNYGTNDKIIISILSQNSNGNLSEGTIQNYTYDCISSELTEKSIEIDIEEIITSEYNSLTTMEIQRIHYLKDQSVVAQLCETNYSYGNDVASSLSSKNMVIFKIENGNDLAWIRPIERYGFFNWTETFGANLDYLTDDNDLEIIFNGSERDFRDGYYSANNYGVFNKTGTNYRAIPVKAKINLANGEVEIKRILPDEYLSNFSLGDAQKMDGIGVYKLFVKNAGKYNVSVIDFKK